jgi:enoyl-CoA hydratase/carnithine racemase
MEPFYRVRAAMSAARDRWHTDLGSSSSDGGKGDNMTAAGARPGSASQGSGPADGDQISETDSPGILVSHAGPVAIITLNRPEVLNAITYPMARAYAAALRAADADPGVRVVVVTGAGRGFCSGADLTRLSQGGEAIRRFVVPAEDLPTVAFRIRKPVIAAVNGPVAGIGFGYMMGSDIRFAAADAKISTTFARLGLVAEYGLAWLLPRAIGTAWSLDLLLSARTITGAEAGRIGLVQYVSTNSVLDDAVGYATRLAETSSPYSMAAAKAQVYAGLDTSADEAIRRAVELMDESFDNPDLPAALAARAEGRPPEFGPLPPG